jgi:histidinol-phosphate/aromatic aminotransferase/cobyric acid decarboxylase-like protein
LVNVEGDAQAFQKKLMEKNVRVRAYDNDAIKNYIRVTLGTLDEMQVTVDVIKEVLKA